MAVLTRTGGVLARLALVVIIAAAIGAMLATIVLPPAVLAGQVLTTVDREVFDVPPLPAAEPIIENSFVYDGDGNEIAEISLNESRLLVDYADIPQVMIDAVLATEDATFFEHDGINVESIARAFINNAAAGEITSGASTITQQYVKNVYIDADRRSEQTYDRKIQEALWAIQLEQRVPKEDILEGYLNRIALGRGIYGIGKAAERYFSTTVQQLTLTEAATIAGVIRSPEGNNPLTNPANALERRNVVLDQMARTGRISVEQAEAAKALPLGVDPTEPGNPDEPFWIDFVTRQLYSSEAAEPMGVPRDLLDALGDDQDARIASVFQGGLRIYTTLDPDLQAAAVDEIDNFLTYEGEPREEVALEPYGGIVSVVPGDGAITTMAIGPFDYGSCDEPVGYDAQGRELCDLTQFNPLVPADSDSTRSGRQPGSSFKPLLTTAALEAGFPPGWTAETTSGQLIEGPARCSEQEPWRPNNSGGGGGLKDMYSGLQASSNVFHAQLISEVGPLKVQETAQRMGIFSSNLDAVCSMALGSEEVFPLEMASAYATLAASGTFCQPYAISRIEDRAGNLLYEHTQDCEQAIDPTVANRVVDIMEGPVNPGGTAPQIAGELSPHPVRGKTGTTQDYRDAWFVGFVPQLATAAWVGYPNGLVTYDCELNPDRCEQVDTSCFDVDTSRNVRRCVETRFLANETIAGQFRSRVFGGTIPAPMWSSYMRRAMDGVEVGSFPSPGAVPGAVVPDLSQVGSIAQMRELLGTANLRLFIESVPDFRPQNSFVAQLPAPGTSVQAGSAVLLRLSNGSVDAPTVPNVLGFTRQLAVERLTSLGFTVVIQQVAVEDENLAGVVVAQDPPSGVPLTVPEGGTIDVTDDDRFVSLPDLQDEPDPEPTSSTPNPTRVPVPGAGQGSDGDESVVPDSTDTVTIQIGRFVPPPPEPDEGDGDAPPADGGGGTDTDTGTGTDAGTGNGTGTGNGSGNNGNGNGNGG